MSKLEGAWAMPGRQVRIQHDVREVSVAVGCGPATFRYAGITIHRIDGDVVVDRTWIPFGTAPTFADDEALLTAWHAALQWSRSPT